MAFDDEIQRIRADFLVAAPVALAALIWGGWLVSQRAVRPLRRVTRTANRRCVADLSHRIEASGSESSEFANLIDVLNDMMERLERGLLRQDGL